MPHVQRDDYGLWIDLGHGALRPAGPISRFNEGDDVNERHFEGSSLHGVGEIAGRRGADQEAWLSAPQPRGVHDPSRSRVSFQLAMRGYLLDVATLKQANPQFNPADSSQDLVSLALGREAYLSAHNRFFGMDQLTRELVAEGQAVVGFSVESVEEARELRKQVPPAPEESRRGPRT